VTEDGDEGQAATELALVLPLVVLLLLAVVQVTLVARDQILVVHAAREGAREAAVDPRPAEVRAAARRAALGLKPGRLGTETGQNEGVHGLVIVRVTYRVPTDVPLLGPLLPDIVVRANAAMRQESPAVRDKSLVGIGNTAGTGPEGTESQQHGVGGLAPARLGNIPKPCGGEGPHRRRGATCVRFDGSEGWPSPASS
jgi:hypothetical protein